MKTISISVREVIAWLVFVCGIALLSVSVAFAQDKKSTNEKKNTVHIKIEKNEDGKKTKIDTTVTKDQLPELKAFLKKSGIDFDTDDDRFSFDDDFASAGNNNIVIHYDKQKMKEDMKKLHRDLDKMKEQIKDIHIEINGDEDADNGNWNFNMNVPQPPTPPHVYMHKEKSGDGKGRSRSYSYSYSSNDDVPDSLNDENHIIINGGENEENPEFEKAITGKNGEKIFVFKRKIPRDETAKANTSMSINHLKVSPNPSADGKVWIKFNTVSAGDLTISVTDSKGKEVFSDVKKDFNGPYSNEIDLSTKGKGDYWLKISYGDDGISKKITVQESK